MLSEGSVMIEKRTIFSLLEKVQKKLGVRQKLIGAFSAVSALAVISGIVAFFAFETAGTALREITDRHIPPMIEASELLLQSERLAADVRAFASIEDAEAMPEAKKSIENTFAQVDKHMKAVIKQFPANENIKKAEEAVKAILHDFQQIYFSLIRKVSANDLLLQSFEKLEMERNKITSNLAPAYSFTKGQIENGKFILEDQPDNLREYDTAHSLLKDVISATEDRLQYSELERLSFEYEGALKNILKENEEAKLSLAMIQTSVILDKARDITFKFPPQMQDVFGKVVTELAIFSEGSDATKSIIDLKKEVLKSTKETQGVVQNLYVELNDLGTAVGSLKAEVAKNISIASINAKKVTDQMLMAVAVSTVTSLLVSIFTVWFYVIKNVGVRLTNLHEKMRALSRGDLTVEVETKGFDEISKMAAAVEVFKTNAIQIENMKSEESVKEYTQKTELAQELDKIAVTLEEEVQTMAHGVKDLSSLLQEASDDLDIVAGDTRHRSEEAEGASQETSHAVGTVAAAVEELAATIAEIQRQASHSSRISISAKEQSDDANIRVDSLTEAAHRIGKVTELISDIADQTNLLALNATIEAARAGEHGKGFAVVASEVKSLADQTAKATDEITKHIKEIQSATQDAATSISSISSTIVQINEIAVTISETVGEQGKAASEISENMRIAADKTEEVHSGINAVFAASERAKGLSVQVRDASGNTAQQIIALDSNVELVIKKLRKSAQLQKDAAHAILKKEG
jgi:methyl-accepting chemotaxis protein